MNGFKNKQIMISEKGFWIGDDVACEHAFDARLCTNLIAFFKEQGGTVCDLGCGMGDYTRTLRAAGITVDGYDGNPDTPSLTKGVGAVLDLSIPFEFPEKYDWVLTLEVGEHLPPQYESVFIDNVVNNNKRGIVLSWAVEGQGGHGHFNCRNNNYVKQLFMARGYENDVETEQWLRSQVNLSWFTNTIMVFTKVGYEPPQRNPRHITHQTDGEHVSGAVHTFGQWLGRADVLGPNSRSTNKTIRFVYGTQERSNSVTELVRKAFSNGNAFLIPSTASFNNVFGDVHVGMPKQLFIMMAEVTLTLPEQRSQNYLITGNDGELRVLMK